MSIERLMFKLYISEWGPPPMPGSASETVHSSYMCGILGCHINDANGSLVTCLYNHACSTGSDTTRTCAPRVILLSGGTGHGGNERLTGWL